MDGNKPLPQFRRVRVARIAPSGHSRRKEPRMMRRPLSFVPIATALLVALLSVSPTLAQAATPVAQESPAAGVASWASVGATESSATSSAVAIGTNERGRRIILGSFRREWPDGTIRATRTRRNWGSGLLPSMIGDPVKGQGDCQYQTGVSRRGRLRAHHNA